MSADRYNPLQTNAGTLQNWSVWSANPALKDLATGCLFVQNLITCASDADATTFGAASISTIGGLDVAKSVLIGGDITVHRRLTVNDTSRFLKLVSLEDGATTTTLRITNTTADSVTIAGGVVVSGLSNLQTLQVNGASTFASSISVSGFTNLLNPTNASTSSDGALVVKGGVGIALDLRLGGSIFLDGSIEGSLAGSISIGQGLFTSIADSTSVVTGALQTKGGLGVKLSANIGNTLAVGTSGASPRLFVGTSILTISPDGSAPAYSLSSNNFTIASPVQEVVIQSTQNATSSSTGALQVLGGGSVAQDFFVGGDFRLSGKITGDGTVAFSNTTNSISPITGAVTVSGGVGIALATNIGGALTSGLTINQNATSSTTGSLQTRGGLAVAMDAWIAGQANIIGLGTFSNGFISKASSTISANLDITGGTLSVDGVVNFTNTNDPTSLTSSSSALTVFGGTIIKKSLFVGNTLQVSKSISNAYNAGNAQIYLNGPSANQTTIGVNNLGALQIVSPLGNGQIFQTDSTFTITDGNAPRFVCSGQSLTIPIATSSTALGNGAFILSGGASIGQNLFVGGTIALLSAQDATSTTSASLLTPGGLAVGKSTKIGLNLDILGTTDSSSYTTGSLTVAGGVGISKTLNVGLNLQVGSNITCAGSGTITGAMTVNGTFINNSTNESTSITSGATTIAGGLGVLKSANIGKNLFVGGDQLTNGNADIGGNVNVRGTADSTSSTTGSVVLAGGLGIAKGIFVGSSGVIQGNLTVNGNIYATGRSFTAETENVSIKDNIILVNAGTASSADAGYAVYRAQNANNTLSGDVIQDRPVFSGTVSGSNNTATTVNLGSSASAIDDAYNECWIAFRSGTDANDVRQIKSYNGSTKIATIYSTADQTTITAEKANAPIIGKDFNTIPDGTTMYTLHDTAYGLGSVLTQAGSIGPGYTFGFSAYNPATNPSAKVTRRALVYLDTIDASGSINSNSYLPQTSGGSILLNNSITVTPAGALKGVTSLNGAKAPEQFTKAVKDGTSDMVPLTGALKTFGIYRYRIESSDSSGSFAEGIIGCNQSVTNPAHQTILISIKGVTGEQISLGWNNGTAPYLVHTSARTNANGSNITYTVTLT